jgi:predicted metal-dependent peptidase
MKNNPASLPTQRGWVENIEFFLFRADGVSYALFLHQVIVELTFNIHAIGSIAGIFMRPDGTIIMRLHWPTLAQFDIPVSAEILKHEILHVITGHTSSRGEKLYEKYGRDIAGIAADLVVNQLCNTKLLADAGIKPVTIEMFGFEPNMTTEYYCQKLLQQALNNKSGQGIPVRLPPGIEEQLTGKKSHAPIPGQGEEQKEAQPMEGSWDTFGDLDEEGDLAGPGKKQDPAVKDIRTERILARVKEAMERRDDVGTSGRGFESAEAKEWVAQVKRPPQVAWYSLLRKMESRHLRSLRELTKSRPSRRDPAHFGRVRRFGLYIWFCVDTSGSMGTQQLSLVEPELVGISNRGAIIDILHVDAGVAKVERYRRRSGVMEFAGRGGTDFSPVFLKLKETPLKERPAFVVYLTDGYGGLEAYAQDFNERFGAGAYDSATTPRKVKCPDGVDTLWVIPEGCTEKDKFISDVASFGMVSVIPMA